MKPLRLMLPMLLLSGMCALTYQVAWMREFRLIFGGTTAANGAVLAIFMGGLGLGNLLLGKHADNTLYPLRLYGMLELVIVVSAVLSPPWGPRPGSIPSVPRLESARRFSLRSCPRCLRRARTSAVAGAAESREAPWCLRAASRWLRRRHCSQPS